MNGYATLRRVYVRPPVAESLRSWDAFGWHRPPDRRSIEQEHQAFRDRLAEAGAEVVTGVAHVPGDPDAIYAYDPVLVVDDGTIVLRPGKEGRRGEPEAVARDLQADGVSVLATLEAPATAEGGDIVFLDDATLLVGVGHRTNSAGVEQLASILEPRGITVHRFDLPFHRGPDACLHLMSLLSPLDADLVVAFRPMMPVRLVQLLERRGIRTVEVPDEEFPTMGPNVLALGPRIALALDGNPETRRRMEAEGVEVRVYRGEDVSLNGDGGPTCLARPLLRG
jgi:dimethylargininase